MGGTSQINNKPPSKGHSKRKATWTKNNTEAYSLW